MKQDWAMLCCPHRSQKQLPTILVVVMYRHFSAPIPRQGLVAWKWSYKSWDPRITWGPRTTGWSRGNGPINRGIHASRGVHALRKDRRRVLTLIGSRTRTKDCQRGCF